MQSTVAARIIRRLLALGEPALALLAEEGVTLAEIAAPDARVSYSLLLKLMALAREVTGDPKLGLHGAMTEGGTLLVLETLFRSGRTARDALERAVRFQRLLHESCRFRLEDHAEVCVAHFGIKDGLEFPPAVAEFFAASLILALRKLNVPLGGGCLHFAHAAPEGPEEYEEVLGLRVHFDGGGNRLVLPVSNLEHPLPDADPELVKTLELHAERLLDRLPRARPYAERVRRLALTELPGGHPTLNRMARLLRTSPRTLRRRLEQDGTTYHGVLDELRRDLALSYLKERTMEIEQVAFLLGFSDASALRRAFRRWTGHSLAEHRDAPR
jgi:AraC-like DNA-binding protein